MKINKRMLQHLIEQELNNLVTEAHGLSPADKKRLKAFAKGVDDKEVKRILNFLVKTNVNVDKTQDVTKMKKKQKVEERMKYNPATGRYEPTRPPIQLTSCESRFAALISAIRDVIDSAERGQ
mgnify:CR=1 FL=1